MHPAKVQKCDPFLSQSRVNNIVFLLTLSLHNQKKRLREFLKLSSKGECFDLLSSSLNSLLIHGNQ